MKDFGILVEIPKLNAKRALLAKKKQRIRDCTRRVLDYSTADWNCLVCSPPETEWRENSHSFLHHASSHPARVSARHSQHNGVSAERIVTGVTCLGSADSLERNAELYFLFAWLTFRLWCSLYGRATMHGIMIFYCLLGLFFGPEDESSKFLRNVRKVYHI
jgi:hypothetical protein